MLMVIICERKLVDGRKSGVWAFKDYETFAKRPLLPNLSVRFIPPGGTRNFQYIAVVKILAFLDLDQISADFEIEHFSKVSL